MNFNNLKSSHGIQYNIRFWRFFQFSQRKIFTCLQHSENDTKRRDISSIDVLQVHDWTATSFHSHLAFAVTSSVLSTFFHLYCVSSGIRNF